MIRALHHVQLAMPRGREDEARAFYLVMTGCTAGAIGIDYLGISPMKALVWSAVINGFLSPPLLVVILLVANDRSVMGDRVNGRTLNAVGWVTAALMAAAAVALVWTWCWG